MSFHVNDRARSACPDTSELLLRPEVIRSRLKSLLCIRPCPALHTSTKSPCHQVPLEVQALVHPSCPAKRDIRVAPQERDVLPHLKSSEVFKHVLKRPENEFQSAGTGFHGAGPGPGLATEGREAAEERDVVSNLKSSEVSEDILRMPETEFRGGRTTARVPRSGQGPGSLANPGTNSVRVL